MKGQGVIMGIGSYTYGERISALRQEKLRQTTEKQKILGAMNYDDWAIILPPDDRRNVRQSMSGSGVAITDCVLNGLEMKSNHETGGFFGPVICGENFRALLEAHPVYIDPMSSLAGGYMVNFNSYRQVTWNPEYRRKDLETVYAKYGVTGPIGGAQHFCQDLAIGLKKGWSGLLEDIGRYSEKNGKASEGFYIGLRHVVLGMMDWIGRHAMAAREMAAAEKDGRVRKNLEEMAAINAKIVKEPPESFREACQWILWYQMAARMYNGSGSLGKLDVLLDPYYEKDIMEAGLSEEEAVFHIACMLLRDTSYIQLGGPEGDREDVTSRLSYLVLEAAHSLKIPANIGVAVGDKVDSGLARRGMEILFEDKAATPKFLGVDNTVHGFLKNGYPLEAARGRAYAGCHWLAIPGREYAIMDIIKINFVSVFIAALEEMMGDSGAKPGSEELWKRFAAHLEKAVAAIAEGIDYHTEHMHKVFPELVMNLLCHGPIEKGVDASAGSLEYYPFGIDGAGLATAADSFAAIRQRVEEEKRLSWEELKKHLENDWSGPEGELARLMMKNIRRYGTGNTFGDKYAEAIAKVFAETVRKNKTKKGYDLLPGLFSWALNISMGRSLGATPNGRHAGEPISHGANPDPGFRKDGAATALAKAVAAVQPGYGNTAPMQIDIDPMITREEGGVDLILGIINAHFKLGGTQVNINVMDEQKVLEAYEDPGRYPDLVVRVTGFSAYFSSLSPEFRKIVVDRIIKGA